MRFKVEAINVGNALQNYIWMLTDTDSNHTIAIDPTRADLVLDYCQTHQLKLCQIWITHKHHDHIDGVAELQQQTQATTYAPLAEKEQIVCADHWLQDGDVIDFNDFKVEIIATPGHTLGHICYFIDTLDILFSGDTLFAMGCGRLFEGTYAQMYHSLNRLAALPPRTQVYCTHEYTESNARFALTVEPDNILLQERYTEVTALRDNHQITLPTNIALELETNPFLRCQNIEEFQKLRQLKDQF